MRAIAVGLLVLVVSFITCGPTRADVRVVAVPDSSAPVAATKCTSDGTRRFTNIFNRTNYLLRSFTLRWTAFDANDKREGGADVEYDIDGLGSGGSDGYYEDVPTAAFTSGSAASISWYSCKLIAATVDGGPKWSIGKTWPEKLLPLPGDATPTDEKTPNGSGNLAGASNASQSGPLHSLQFTVIKSWTDAYGGQYFIHDTLQIHGGTSEVTITPDIFVLTVNLENGGIARYTALTQAAPIYMKWNYMVGFAVAQYQVTPASDLGALGSLIVPAGGTVKVIVTWVSPAPPKDLNSNPNVTVP